MFKKLLPKEQRFFELYQNLASDIRKGISLFDRLLSDYTRRGQLTREIKEAENAADHISHEIFHLLNNTFITPFDREDMQLLTIRMDDVIDMVEKASARLDIYDVATPPPDIATMLHVLDAAFVKAVEAIGLLHDMKNRDTILSICVEINRLENEGDEALRNSLRRLFRDNNDPLHVLKMKDVYESLEEAIDRCEDVANVIETILIKNA